MVANRFLDHVLVLPEDDANRQIANGFQLELFNRQVQVLPEAGGWGRVRDDFAEDHVDLMRRYTGRFMILLVDCDGNPEQRFRAMQEMIPHDLTNRVFVLGTYSEPEALKRAGLGTFEDIGRGLANDCRNGTQELWGHGLLKHNQTEIARLQEKACHILVAN